MAYTPPDLSTTVTLEPGYTPPSLSSTVTLGDAVVVSGTLAATLPAVTLPALSFSATGILVEPASSYTPPDLSITVTLSDGYLPPPLSYTIALGEEIVVVPGALTATLPSVALPSLTLTGSATIILTATFSAVLPAVSLPALTFNAAGDQDLDLPDADGPGLTITTQQAEKSANSAGMPQQAMRPLHTWSSLTQTTADPIRVGAALLAAHGLKVQRRMETPHAHGLPIQYGLHLPAADAWRQRRAVTVPHAHGLPIRIGTTALATDTIRTRTYRTLTEQQALPIALRLTVGQHQARITANRVRLQWTTAEWPPPGRWWPRYEVPPLSKLVVLQTGYTPRHLTCPVVLGWTWMIQPYCPGTDPVQPGIVIPVQEVYVVINSFSLVRADNSQPVDVLDFDASLDAGSWAWGWSANVPASQMLFVRSPNLGEFVELIATINSQPLRLVVERVSRSRKFGKSALKIIGRGRAAWLADPHSPVQTVVNTETRTAQQLLNDALMMNGVSIGWAVDWQLEDWSVLAGLWSHTGTYISAASRISESGGGYVQADDTLQTLHILPYYPDPPWQWDAEQADITLPEDVCSVEDIEWQDKPAYNAVYVIGGQGGRQDKIKRTGTAGDVYAPTVVDPLATDTVMTRQRGLRVIADTGRQVHISLRLPVLAATGIIKPGNLIEYTEQGKTHVGLSRAVSLHYEFPVIQQTVRIETHELEPV